jgi:DNA-binding response OmpR family regulator
VRAILRRAKGPAPAGEDAIRRLGDVTLSPASREATAGGATITLRAKEFDLLLTFIDHENVVLSREQLLDLVWGYDFYGQTRTVDVHVAHLRDRLSGSELQIETVWGMGYKLIHNPA